MTALRRELAELAGAAWAVALWDMQKFYDTTPLACMAVQALKRSFPAAVLGMILQSYMAIRTIRCGDCHSKWVQGSRSILAGCGEANNMARVVMYDLIEDLHANVPAAITMSATYVDDAKHFDSDPEPNNLLLRLGMVMKWSPKLAMGKGLVLPPKSGIIGGTCKYGDQTGARGKVGGVRDQGLRHGAGRRYGCHWC